MSSSAQCRAAQVEAVLSAALEAAANRASQRATDVILSARLALAVHMRQAAEHALAHEGRTGAPIDPNREPGSAVPAARARLLRPAGLAEASEGGGV